MNNDIYNNMLSAYDLSTEQQKRNAIFEVNQQVILAGLYNGGFFNTAAFYGGTCLRIFHGLQRFSEDMDFSLLALDEKFDFTRLHGKHVEVLKSLPMLAPLYARKNLAFIGPQGVGKTHLAMAFGRECCLKGFKTYFLKASELNLKFTDARKNGREATVINGLVKPSCLIIDEVGRCVFDKANTRLFFDMIDRRYNKDGPCTMIFTSNKSPAQWREFFSEDDTLLCSLDRIFDDATVFMMKGDSYRGKKLETLGIEACIAKHTEYKNT